MDEILKIMRGMTFSLEDIHVIFHFMICRIDPMVELKSNTLKKARDNFKNNLT